MSQYGTVRSGNGNRIAVARGGQMVYARRPDGAAVPISRKLLELFPEKYTEINDPEEIATLRAQPASEPSASHAPERFVVAEPRRGKAGA